jgi:hypothetical protein
VSRIAGLAACCASVVWIVCHAPESAKGKSSGAPAFGRSERINRAQRATFSAGFLELSLGSPRPPTPVRRASEPNGLCLSSVAQDAFPMTDALAKLLIVIVPTFAVGFVSGTFARNLCPKDSNEATDPIPSLLFAILPSFLIGVLTGYKREDLLLIMIGSVTWGVLWAVCIARFVDYNKEGRHHLSKVAVAALLLVRSFYAASAHFAAGFLASLFSRLGSPG